MILQVMKRALEALEATGKAEATIYKLRAAIEQMEKAEPGYFGLTEQHTWLSVSKDQYEKLRESHRCVFYTHPAQPPEGWQLVPVEPTPEMLVAGWGINIFGRRRKYKTMLAAAPKEKS